jgi:hypothetical protein
MAYSKVKFKSSGFKASPCFIQFGIRKLSDKYLPIQTLLQVSFKHILIWPTSFKLYENTVPYLPPN